MFSIKSIFLILIHPWPCFRVGAKHRRPVFLETGRLKFTQASGRMFLTNVLAEFARIQLFEQEA
ncbi:MAG: hypothetical protein DWI22_10095 [Planctomycetota bacterium]|nr:MAG: hypothetical protein DWI22_10095 [Planctomycetota bacterium]